MTRPLVWTYHTGLYTVYVIEPDLSITFVTCSDCLAALDADLRALRPGQKPVDDLMFRLRSHRALRHGNATVDLAEEANSTPDPL